MQFCFASLYRVARVVASAVHWPTPSPTLKLSLDAIDSYGLEVGRPNTVAVLSQALLDRGEAEGGSGSSFTRQGSVIDDGGTYAQTGLFESAHASGWRTTTRRSARRARRARLGSLEALGIRNPLSRRGAPWRHSPPSVSTGETTLSGTRTTELDLARQWGRPVSSANL